MFVGSPIKNLPAGEQTAISINCLTPQNISGNRCGHDPQNPKLSPPNQIQKGEGAPPRILSLAAERAKDWFWNPQKCPLLESRSDRQTRSERREAIQVVLEYLLSRLDLVTLRIGVPSLKDGCFHNLNMKSIVEGTGLGQRRCERAIGDLKAAGFMKVAQPRYCNEEGKYSGLYAVRCLTIRFFEWLNLGPMLRRERTRATQTLKKRAAKFGLSLKDVVGRKIGGRLKQLLKPTLQTRKSASQEISRPWNDLFGQKIRAGLDHMEARQLVNEFFGYPSTWSPGYGDPAEFAR